MFDESSIKNVTPNGKRRIVVLRGLPGSGKSTFAINAVETFPGLIARINNDELATSLFGKPWTPELINSGQVLHSIRIGIIKNLLKNSKIEIIILDNTNLVLSGLKYLDKIALEFDVEIIYEDSFLGVSIEECIRRDSLRANPVGKEVILKLSQQINQ